MKPGLAKLSRLAGAACTFLCVSVLAEGGAVDALFSADGYRIARYRAALPQPPPAGRRIDTPSLARLIERQDPVLVDVQAVTVRPEGAEFGVSWLPNRTRHHIPGSTWLPNVGYGQLEPRMQAYLEHNLARLTAGDRDRAVVFYCVVDCWMSWNAVKRAAGLGYRNLFWYPEGTDGWREAGLELAAAWPLPLDLHEGCVGDGFFACAPDGLPGALARAADIPSAAGVLLFFETDECPFCRRMKQGLLTRQTVVDYYRERFVVMPVNLESETVFTGRDGSKTTQAAFAREQMRVYRTPTLVFLDAGGEELFRHAGIIVDPGVFLGLADYVAEGHHERVGFREYLAVRAASGAE